eukprot:scaffold22378_cov79-Skeletonema_dohrnii-CCMP3373.AAC.1
MKTSNINKILSGGASAMLPRSSSSGSASSSQGSESGSEESSSLGSNHSSSDGGASSKQSSQKQRQRGSYASATASSKARGGPTSSAPKAKPASSMKATIRPLPKLATDKENDANSTPVKPPPPPQENCILSPTPYYKVLEERGGKASPRLTRSAMKRAQTRLAMDSLAQLENNHSEEDEANTPLPHGGMKNNYAAASSNNNDGYDTARMSLQFQPPDRHEWQQQRSRQQKVRKSIQPSSRNAKRAKYNSNNNKNNNTNNETGEQMTSDQVRQIMHETLQSSQNDTLLQLSAEAASAKKEVEVTKLQLEELQNKYCALEECWKVREGSESEE